MCFFFNKKVHLLVSGLYNCKTLQIFHDAFLKTETSILQQYLHSVRHVFHIFLIIHLLSQIPPTPTQKPSANQPTVRMQSLYVSVVTPLYALCISIVLDKHGGDAELMRELQSTYLRNNGVY